jgi:plastocyanin
MKKAAPPAPRYLMKIQKLLSLAAVGLTLSLAGCSAGEGNSAQAAPAGAEAASAAAAPATGKVVEVKMLTDEKGNYFEPKEVTVKAGDVVRFTLVSGVHNVSFPADQNAGASGLPEASSFLQLPGQTFDLPVSLAAGAYTFQCDPHAALGMVGTLTVQ